jgi:hypothetical protein
VEEILRSQGVEAVKKSQDEQNCFTPRRKARKGRKEKKGLPLCVPLRLGAFAKAVLIFSQLRRPGLR